MQFFLFFFTWFFRFSKFVLFYSQIFLFYIWSFVLHTCDSNFTSILLFYTNYRKNETKIIFGTTFHWKIGRYLLLFNLNYGNGFGENKQQNLKLFDWSNNNQKYYQINHTISRWNGNPINFYWFFIRFDQNKNNNK